MAKALAEFLFAKERHMIRIDMSEYMERRAARPRPQDFRGGFDECRRNQIVKRLDMELTKWIRFTIQADRFLK